MASRSHHHAEINPDLLPQRCDTVSLPFACHNHLRRLLHDRIGHTEIVMACEFCLPKHRKMSTGPLMLYDFIWYLGDLYQM